MQNLEDLEMIRNRSPPGVCWLTVHAGSGILKIFIAFFHPGSGVNVAALHRWKAGGLFSSTFSPSVTRKFQKNFCKISPLFHRPCNRFLDEKMRYRGVLKSPRNFLENRKKFLHFYANFLFRLPIKSSSK